MSLDIEHQPGTLQQEQVCSQSNEVLRAIGLYYSHLFGGYRVPIEEYSLEVIRECENEHIKYNGALRVLDWVYGLVGEDECMRTYGELYMGAIKANAPENAKRVKSLFIRYLEQKFINDPRKSLKVDTVFLAIHDSVQFALGNSG